MWRIKYEDLEELGLLSYFKFFELKGIAKKMDDSIENLGTKINLSMEEFKIEPKIIETDSILAFHVSKEGKFNLFLKNIIEKKCFKIEGREVSYKKTIDYIRSSCFYDTMIVESYKESIPIEDAIHDEFITQLKEPYDGFYDFCEEFLGKRDFGGGRSSWIEIRIPLEEIFQLSKEKNILKIKTRIELKDIILRIIVHGKNGAVSRLNKKLSNLSEDRGYFVLHLPNEIQETVVFPIFKKRRLGRFNFLEPPKYNIVEHMIHKWIEKHGYTPDKNYDFRNVSSLEWHIYSLFSSFSSCLWIGLKEELWKEVFKEFGFVETVDFIIRSKNEKEIFLVECMQSYTTKEGDIGERAIRKLLYLKEKLSELGINVHPIFIIGELWEDNKKYLEGKIREDINYVFKENLDTIQQNLSKIKTPEDLIKYCHKPTEIRWG